MTNTTISVIIPTHNKARYLDLSLASWCGQECNAYELVIVDDGSTDETADILAKYRRELPIEVVRISHAGRSAARNHGLTAAKGRWIVFVDDDRIVPRGFLRAHSDRATSDGVIIGWQQGMLVDFANHGDQHIQPATIASLLRERPRCMADILAGGSGQIVTAMDIREGGFDIGPLRLEDPWEPHLERLMQTYGEDLTACPLAWGYGTTGNLSVSRELLTEAGHFDEGFIGWGLEDTELHYRLVKAGARTRVARDAVNYHQNHPKSVSFRRGEWARNARRFLEKHATLEAALYIHASTDSLSHEEACRIAADAVRLGECPSVGLLRSLALKSALDIVSRWGSSAIQ